MSESNNLVKIGEEEISLMDLAGLNIDEIQEYRGFTMPMGVYRLKVTGGGLDSIETTDKKTQAKVNKPIWKLEVEVLDVIAIADPEIEPDSLIGQKYTESYFISDLAKDVGAIVAFCHDAGMTSASIGDLVTTNMGHEFVAKIKQTANKNDPDRPYTNFSRKKGDVRPVNAETPA